MGAGSRRRMPLPKAKLIAVHGALKQEITIKMGVKRSNALNARRK
jgi:hypothetical protein